MGEKTSIFIRYFKFYIKFHFFDVQSYDFAKRWRCHTTLCSAVQSNPTHTLASWQPLTCSHPQTSAFSNISQRQNLTICLLSSLEMSHLPLYAPMLFLYAAEQHPLHGWTVAPLFSRQPKDIRVVSSFCKLWLKLPWKFVCRFYANISLE